MSFQFKVIAQDGLARSGEFTTPHGVVQMPTFMPVGTQATIKGLTPEQVRQTGVQVVLANTYHLMIRPGPFVVQQAGGLHRFMAWEGPILTDSGGFQVMSLAAQRKITEEGVTFRSHLDGSEHHLTPERAVQIQEALGADMIMALDECPPYPSPAEYMAASIARTARWLRRCLEAKSRDDQALLGITQGGVDRELRRASTKLTVQCALPGYAIGGLAVGESKEEMYHVLPVAVSSLPEQCPRYLMGVGYPCDLVAAIGWGVDLFDCVYPTRTARFGTALVPSGRLNLKNARFHADFTPLDANCCCYTCAHFTRAYLRHVFLAGEMLARTLLSLHNIHFVATLVEEARKAIAAGAYREFAREFGEQYFQGAVPEWYSSIWRK